MNIVNVVVSWYREFSEYCVLSILQYNEYREYSEYCGIMIS